MLSPVSFVTIVAVNLLLAAGAYWRKAVTAGGAAVGFLVSAGILIFSGWSAWTVLGAFFLSSSILSRIGRARKESSAVMIEKGDRRDSLQVMANGGIGFLAATIYALSGNTIWLAALAASFAEANADTWATEIGMLSRQRPVSIISGRAVPAGMSGGVTAFGTVAALLGALFIGLIYGIGLLATNSWSLRPRDLLIVGIVTGSGFAGSIVDSVIGATIQATYRDESTGRITERKTRGDGTKNIRIRGLSGVNNDVVNIASCATGAVIAALLSALVR